MTEDEMARREQTAKASLFGKKRCKTKRCQFQPIPSQLVSFEEIKSPYIAEYAKKRANGICQLCGKKAPFNRPDGEPYLESHHIEWLSKGGADSIGNTVALCPNCHKKMHIVNLENDVRKLKKIINIFE